MPSPYLGESEPDSDYELKAIHVKPSHISAEDLADDEREDTSEGEPEPDYDTDVHNQSQRMLHLYLTKLTNHSVCYIYI